MLKNENPGILNVSVFELASTKPDCRIDCALTNLDQKGGFQKLTKRLISALLSGISIESSHERSQLACLNAKALTFGSATN